MPISVKAYTKDVEGAARKLYDKITTDDFMAADELIAKIWPKLTLMVRSNDKFSAEIKINIT